MKHFLLRLALWLKLLLKKLACGHASAAFDADNMKIIKQEVYTSLKMDFDVLVEKSLKQHDLRILNLNHLLIPWTQGMQH